MSSAYLIIAHGSREKQSNQAFAEFIEKFQAAFPKRKIYPGFLELSKPSIPEAIQNCIEEGADEIFVIPFMLLPGRHVKEHIPEFIRAAKEQHPEVDFHYSGPLTDDSAMIELLGKKIKGLKEKS